MNMANTTTDFIDYPFEEKAYEFLKTALNDENAEFKPQQLQAILSAVKDRNKLLLVQKTGWGKSMVYFIATKILRDPEYASKVLNLESKLGPAIMVSPLLSLMRNQVLAGKEIIEIDLINYKITKDIEQYETVKRRVLAGEVDLLIITPERLSNPEFIRTILNPIAPTISTLIIDEVHCVSDWGHDFRPDYMRIKSIISQLPKRTPIIATTATANDRVVEDVGIILGENTVPIRGPLARGSLCLHAIKMPNITNRLAFLAKEIPLMQSTGIVYTLTVKDTRRVAGWLQKNGISALAYSAETDDRETIEQLLLDDKIDVIVATTALGMGFDKPNVGFVIHYQTPQSVVHYYQQVGRAGRQLPKAFGICLLGSEDEDINEYFIEKAFPKVESFELVDDALQSFGKEGASLGDLQQKINVRYSTIQQVLKILSALDNPSVVKNKFRKWVKTVNPMFIDWSKIEAIREQRKSEWKEMLNYFEHNQCHMQYLQKVLNDPDLTDDNCGRCAVCEDIESFGDIAEDLIINAQEFLKRLHGDIEPRRIWGTYQFKSWPRFTGTIQPEYQLEPGKFLCYYHDQIYGHQLRKGKREGKFEDSLIEALVDMIVSNEKWGIVNKIEWVTAVPSLRNPDLVPVFAEEVASRLGKPFIPAVEKIKHSEPQKNMLNAAQCKKNLDGSLSIKTKEVQKGPVLLIDDIVDTRWTFTIIGALLRDADCETIYPCAIGSSNNQL